MTYHGVQAFFPAGDRWRGLLSDDPPCSRPGGPEDQCLAAMMQTLGTELIADALLVEWFAPGSGGLAIHMDEHCRADAGLRLLLHEFADRLAKMAEGGTQPIVREGSSPRGQIVTIAFPTGGGVVIVTTLAEMPRPSSVRPPGLPGDFAGGPHPAGFIPMLRPFFDLWATSRSRRLRDAGLAWAVEHCDIAMFLVDRQSKVLFANRAGEELAAVRDGIDIGRGRLAATALADTMRLQAAIEHICGEARDHGMVLPIVALRRARGRPLMATVLPVPNAEPSPDEGSAILYVFDPEEDLSRLIEPACMFYGLSAGETQLTCRLADGESLAQAAKALGLREQTARSYLKQIFLKTQTNRQAELVWLMLKSAVRVTNAARMRVF